GQHEQHQHQHETPKKEAQHMSGVTMMPASLGKYPMSQEGSGTAWNPAASPVYMLMLPKHGRYDFNLMGLATLNYTKQGGPRGESQLFSNSMVMGMAQRETGGGTLAFRAMLSLDPLFNGKKGYPLLFQTGETADGQPMKDRQHPHDLFSELAVSFARSLSESASGFVYAGLVGEPALGDVMYLHRPSTGDNVEAPITHHWFDSTHISYGVLTGGLIFNDKLKLDASLFNGKEPDENRYDIDPIRLDSASARLEYNPTSELSFSGAYGFLKEPERLEPGVGVHRLTAAIQHTKQLGPGRSLSTGFFFGRNENKGKGSNAFNLEGAYTFGDSQVFARAERVDKDELVGVPVGTYRVDKLTVGASHNLMKRDGLEYALAGTLSFYSYPQSLDPFYGKNPVSLGIFLRVRPGRMSH
ncbi:MAG: hypothetical protein ACAH95_10305, partial [Fimbriimonas sp.]